MITKLHVRRFKSIRDLEIQCRRINFFIGAPSVGKSNLLESLGLYSWAYFSDVSGDLKEFIRYKVFTNLFPDNNVHETIEIDCDALSFQISFKDGHFQGLITAGDRLEIAAFEADYDHVFSTRTSSRLRDLASFRFYRFRSLIQFDRPESDSLIPPSGRNLTSLLLGNRDLRAVVAELFAATGAKLGLRPDERTVELTKEADDVLISYPLITASDSLVHMMFYISAILSNRGAIITLEEPESHVFPFYSKQLADLLIDDSRNNQFFVTTHNPYLLLPAVFKSNAEDVAVHVVYLKDGHTVARRLEQSEIAEFGDIDIFSNLDRYTKNQ